MKQALSVLIFGICFLTLHSQNIGIGTTTPDSSAMLEIRSNNKGILLPRVFLNSVFDTTTIVRPALSLLVFNTNPALEGGKGYYTWGGTNWTLIMSAANSFTKGKNRFLTIVDGDTREYFVHVPDSYDGVSKVPVVIMLHGTSGDGERFYNTSGWTDVADDENIIAVFPSSWRYCIIDGGGQKTTTKWNTLPDADWVLCPGQTGRDDIKFLKKIIAELRIKFSIDTTHIYLEGFSNGGQMAAKCAIEMSDIFAAAVENAGSFYKDTTYTPKRLLPVMFQIGNDDWGPGNAGPHIWLSYFNSILAGTFPSQPIIDRFHRPANRHVRNFNLNTNFIIVGDTASLVMGAYTGLSGNPLNLFRYVFVNGLGHQYPNGDNHWMEAARYHWAWMKQYVLPH